MPPLSGFDYHNIHSKNIHSKSLTHQSEPEEFKQAKSIIWKIVPIGIISALIGACIGVKAIFEYIIFAFLPIGLLATLFKRRIVKNNQGEIKNSVLAVFINLFFRRHHEHFNHRRNIRFWQANCH